MNNALRKSRSKPVRTARNLDEDVNDLTKRSFAFEGALNIIDASRALIDIAQPNPQKHGVRPEPG
jgi:hypothetical protein